MLDVFACWVRSFAPPPGIFLATPIKLIIIFQHFDNIVVQHRVGLVSKLIEKTHKMINSIQIHNEPSAEVNKKAELSLRWPRDAPYNTEFIKQTCPEKLRESHESRGHEYAHGYISRNF